MKPSKINCHLVVAVLIVLLLFWQPCFTRNAAYLLNQPSQAHATARHHSQLGRLESYKGSVAPVPSAPQNLPIAFSAFLSSAANFAQTATVKLVALPVWGKALFVVAILLALVAVVHLGKKRSPSSQQPPEPPADEAPDFLRPSPREQFIYDTFAKPLDLEGLGRSRQIRGLGLPDRPRRPAPPLVSWPTMFQRGQPLPPDQPTATTVSVQPTVEVVLEPHESAVASGEPLAEERSAGQAEAAADVVVEVQPVVADLEPPGEASLQEKLSEQLAEQERALQAEEFARLREWLLAEVRVLELRQQVVDADRRRRFTSPMDRAVELLAAEPAARPASSATAVPQPIRVMKDMDGYAFIYNEKGLPIVRSAEASERSRRAVGMKAVTRRAAVVGTLGTSSYVIGTYMQRKIEASNQAKAARAAKAAKATAPTPSSNLKRPVSRRR
eukprot:EG_transcript_8740